MHISIIGGSGRLGVWYARRFREAGHTVTITGRNQAKLSSAASAAGVEATEDNESALRRADVAIVSTHIDTTSALIEAGARLLPPGALLTDFASVKAPVVAAYQAIDRTDIERVSLHPLHGPRVRDLAGVTVLAIPFRAGSRYDTLRRFFAGEGAGVVEVGAEQHDADMALLQGLTHFVAIAAGRTLAETGVPRVETPAYALLKAAIARVVLQDPALYAAIQLENPNNARVRGAFQQTARRLCELSERGQLLDLQKEIEACAVAFADPERELLDTDVCLVTLAGRRRTAPATRIGLLGPPGTFSDVAVQQYARAEGLSVSPAYYRTIPDVFDAVLGGSVPFGMVPVENMIDGTIVATLNLLFETGLKVCGELLVPIHHSLAAVPGTRLESIQRVLSIAPVLGQVRTWLRTNRPDAKLVETTSSAEAIHQVARLRYEGDAAVGLAATAEAAGLEVLARDIEDEKNNVTRFVLIGNTDAPRTGHDRTSLCVHDTANRPGVLHHVLAVIASQGLNLSKIQSRPTRKRLGQYNFYIDVEAHREDDALKAALEGVAREAQVTVLGSYPRAF